MWYCPTVLNHQTIRDTVADPDVFTMSRSPPLVSAQARTPRVRDWKLPGEGRRLALLACERHAMASFYGCSVQGLDVRRLRPPGSALWFLPEWVRPFYSPPWMERRAMFFMASCPKDDDGLIPAAGSIWWHWHWAAGGFHLVDRLRVRGWYPAGLHRARWTHTGSPPVDGGGSRCSLRAEPGSQVVGASCSLVSGLPAH